ncbi:E3 ubiquitin protein ligase DRIP2 [Dichanthelium oligosanthes]|uniref:E3 ubiquitin protein ligase DRIP2 n=1 Tax=Dichanthelium oligosanthes TaxID=888268 RepID=A0A1E5VNV6_9POAL|nr:E3 ubiquitin protein ligase DRIP2 [Dichanthelium oligosanthes]
MGEALPQGVALVRRDLLTPGLTCPLCKGLFREATALTECLHTFCRECIMEQINGKDIEYCPVCDVHLGCDPEQKLRSDKNLQDIRNKLFPIKEKETDSTKAATTLPPKRKKRSLSSLLVDTPSTAMKTGLTRKRTKGTRKAAASRATSPGKNGAMKSPTKSEGRDKKTEKSSAPQSTKVATTAKKTESQDQKKIEKTSAQQSTKEATAENKKQCNTDVEVPSEPPSEDRKNNGKTADKEELQKPSKRSVYAASKTKAPRSTPKIHSVTEEQIEKKERELPTGKEETENAEEQIKKKEGEIPTGKDETVNEVAVPGTMVGEHSNKPTITEDSSNQGSSGSSSTLHDTITAPVWFSLASSPNQGGGPQLPQLSMIYLRIKDGNMQISLVQRYIAEKLNLGDEDEVEITIDGQPICPSSTLHGLVQMWPLRGWSGRCSGLGAPANEFVMTLGYRRRHRPYLVPRFLAVPKDKPCEGEDNATVEAAAPPDEPLKGDRTSVEAAAAPEEPSKGDRATVVEAAAPPDEPCKGDRATVEVPLPETEVLCLLRPSLSIPPVSG